MAEDILTKPLGSSLSARNAPKRVVPVGRIGAGLCLFAVVGAMGFSFWRGSALGGEPIVTASIERMPKRESGALETSPGPQAQVPPSNPNIRELPPQQDRQDAGEVEQGTGVKVMRPRNAQAPGAVVIRVPDQNPSIKLAPAPDRRLVEKGRHGSLPKVSPEGLRPADIYARPVTPQQRTAPVRIAIVVGGLGIGANTTQDAIQRLPGPINLAFAPYGADLERQVARARDGGHEVLLQVPMEPFDYPDNDPGPQTLVSTLAAEQNMDRLQWLLSRFPGYVGVVNFMGGRFTSSDAALAPVMREISSRGLLFLDDGSSGRSIASQAAASAGASSAKADIVVDAVQRGTDIDAALARLEKLAREKGSAIGFGTALPVTVERIARWAKAAESRGVILVPVSALATSPRRS